MTHFELIFTYVMRQRSFFVYKYPVALASFIEKIILSLLSCFDVLDKNQLTINLRVYFWILISVPLIYMSILMPHIIVAFYQVLKLEILSPLTLFLLKIVLVILRSYSYFYESFRFILSISVKNAAGIFIKITLSL